MTRVYLWAGAFLLLLCQLCAVYGDKGVDTSPSSSSSDGEGVAMYSDLTSMEEGGNDRSNMKEIDKTWLAPSGETVYLSECFHVSESCARLAPVALPEKVSVVVDYLFGAFIPSILNPALYMSTSKVRECVAEVANRVRDGLHPVSYSATLVDIASQTMDAAHGTTTSWVSCPSAERLVQISLFTPASIADEHALSPLFDEGEGKEGKDTEEGDIDVSLDKFFADDDDDPPLPPLCPLRKRYYDPDGSEAVDTRGVRLMDRPAHHGYGSTSVNGYANGYINDLDIGMAIANGVDNDIDQDIDEDISHDIDHGSFGKGLYLHGSQPSVCPVPQLLPSIVSVVGPSLASFFLDQGPEFESRWKQHKEAMGDAVLSIDPGDEKEEQLLAEASRAVAAGESLTLEAYIAVIGRREQERKALEGDHEEEDTSPSLARNILGVMENATGYIGSLFKGALPSSWVNPTAGQMIQRADECFLEVESMPVRPGCDPYTSLRPPSSIAPTCATSDAACNGSDVSAVSDAASDGAGSSAALGASANGLDYGDGGWFYCVHHGRLVQQDPLFVCSSIAIAGCSSVEMSSPAPYNEHFSRDQDDDDDYDFALDSLFDTLLAADRTRYEAEHMQLAHFVDPTVHLPAAVEARLARHIAELADERAGFETILKSMFDHDEQAQQEQRRVDRQRMEVALERRVTTQMQHLLFGGGGENQREEDEEPLTPAGASITPRDALPPISRPPMMDECNAAETLHGNDQHATSRGDCRMMNPDVHLFRDTGVSIEYAYVSSFGYDTAEPLFDFQGYLYDLAGRIGLLNGRQVESVVDFLWAVWAKAHEAIAPVSFWPFPDEKRVAKTAVFTDVEAVMHGDEFEAFRLKTHDEQREAAERETALRATLSSALDDERKAAAQSADLAAKLADVQQQLEDVRNDKDDLTMELDEARKTLFEQDEALELASSTARICRLALDDKKLQIYQLETVLTAEFTGEGAKEGWRLQRAKHRALDTYHAPHCITNLTARQAMLDFEDCTALLEKGVDQIKSLSEELQRVEPRMRSLFEEGQKFRRKEEECSDSLEEQQRTCKFETLELERHPASMSGGSVACECSGMEALLPDDVYPALFMATRQALQMCFEEAYSTFGVHHAVCFVDHHDE